MAKWVFQVQVGSWQSRVKALSSRVPEQPVQLAVQRMVKGLIRGPAALAL